MPATEPELHQLEEHYARKTRRTRLYFGAALIVAITITAALVLSLGGSNNKPQTHPTALPTGSEVATAGAPTHSTGSPSAQPSPASNADLTTETLAGATLPVSKTSGPRVIGEGLATGFAETPLGAALAAVHIGYRLDPSVGAAIYTATAQRQTIGDSAALIRELQSMPAAPDSGPVAEYVGYRIADYSTTELVTVHEEALQPGTSQRFDVPVNVQWTGQDWKVVLPLPTETTSVTDTSVYSSF